MGQDSVDAWPSPKSFLPSPEGQRESGIAVCPEWPQPALRAWALGKGLVTWPLWRGYLVSPTFSPQPQPVLAPPIVGMGLRDPGTHCLLPSTQASTGATKAPCCASCPSVVHGVWCLWAPGQIRLYLVSTPILTMNVPLNKVGATRGKKVNLSLWMLRTLSQWALCMSE